MSGGKSFRDSRRDARFDGPRRAGTIPPARARLAWESEAQSPPNLPAIPPIVPRSPTPPDALSDPAARVDVLPADARGWHAALRPMLAARLREAHRPATALFDRQLRDGRWDATHGTEEITSSAIALVALRRAALDPAEIGVDPERVLAAMRQAMHDHAATGPLGLVTWAHAEWAKLPFDELVRACDVPLRDAGYLLEGLTTMELAWLVSGLAHACHRHGDEAARRFLGPARDALLERLAPTRLFVHASPRAGALDRMRRRVANFADQIYPVQALAFVAKLDGDRVALAASESCARRLVETQGSLGQWCWHYDAQRGFPVQAYPVYSVHQHGMAPMALRALLAAGGADLTAAAELGRRWLDRNELGRPFLDLAAGTIWRSLEKVEPALVRLGRKLGSALGAGGESRPDAPAGRLRVNLETRPYEWAWCLYAGALLEAPGAAGSLA